MLAFGADGAHGSSVSRATLRGGRDYGPRWCRVGTEALPEIVWLSRLWPWKVSQGDGEGGLSRDPWRSLGCYTVLTHMKNFLPLVKGANQGSILDPKLLAGASRMF